MPEAQPKGPDLPALAMRRARDDVAQGRVPKHPPGGETQKSDKGSAGSTPGDQSSMALRENEI